MELVGFLTQVARHSQVVVINVPKNSNLRFFLFVAYVFSFFLLNWYDAVRFDVLDVAWSPIAPLVFGGGRLLCGCALACSITWFLGL